MKDLKSLFLGALLAAPVAASATTVVQADGIIAIDDLSGFGGPILGNFTDTDSGALTLAVTGDLAGGVLTASLSVNDASGILLSNTSVIDSMLNEPPQTLAGQRRTAVHWSLICSAAAPWASLKRRQQFLLQAFETD